MGMRRAQDDDVHHAVQHHVVDIAAMTRHETRVFLPSAGTSDLGSCCAFRHRGAALPPVEYARHAITAAEPRPAFTQNAIYLWALPAYMLAATDMTEPSSEPRDIRLKRLRIRSWHRGTQEMDLLLGRFADAELAALSDGELELYDRLLFEDDQDLYAWITGERPWPTSLSNPLTDRLTAFTAKGPRTD
jgi:antitoxin CptB